MLPIDDGEVRLSGQAANNVRSEVNAARTMVWRLEFGALFVMPVLLGLLGNALVTQIYSTAPDNLIISLTSLLLFVCTVLQIVFGISALNKPTLGCTIEDASFRTQISVLKEALRRKSNVHETLRESFDEYNTQVCQLNIWCQSDFQTLLNRVFAPTRATIDKVLGINDRVYSIEVYLDDSCIMDTNVVGGEEFEGDRPFLGSTSLKLWYFHASERVSAEQSLSLGDWHPAVMAWSNHVPDEYSLDRHHQLYGTIQQPAEEIYFRRVLTVPIRMVCTSDNFWGVLVVTTMQNEPVVDDALDNLQWLSTLTTNFVAGYNKCKEAQRERMESERKSLAQRQRREQKAAIAAEPQEKPQ